MAARENPDAIEEDVSKVSTSNNSNTKMTETDKAQEEATLATYQKMAAFTTLKKPDAGRSMGDTNLISPEPKTRQTEQSP